MEKNISKKKGKKWRDSKRCRKKQKEKQKDIKI